MIVNTDIYFIQDNDTPLHWAAFYGHNDVADVLIKAGARIDAINNVSIIIKHAVITIMTVFCMSCCYCYMILCSYMYFSQPL